MKAQTPYLTLCTLLLATGCNHDLTSPAPTERPSLHHGSSPPLTVLFSSGPRTDDEANSLRSNLLVGGGSAETEQQIGDDFTLPARALVQSVSWEGAYFQTPLNQGSVGFTVRISSAPGGVPVFDGPVTATNTQVGTSTYGSPIYRMTADLRGGVILEQDVAYWLTILDSDPSTPIDFRWWKSSAEGAGSYAIRPDPASQWFVQAGDPTPDFTFDLEGVFNPAPPDPSIIVTQGPRATNEANALRSNLNVGPGTSESEQQVADDVVIPTRSQVQGVSWEGSYFQTPVPAGAPAVAFSIRIYDDLNSTPVYEAFVDAAYSQVGTSAFGSPIYRFSASLGTGTTLEANTQYWVSILERDPATPIDFGWWETSIVAPGAYAYRPATSGAFFIQNTAQSHDFTLTLTGGPAIDDTTAPVIQPVVAGTQGSLGWYTSAVDVSWLITDAQSAITSTSGCGPVQLSTDTPSVTVVCSATSSGGTASDSVTLMIDTTAPTAIATAAPGPDANGWSRKDVTVAFAGSDALSGGVTCDANIVLAADGAGQSASGTCRDAAGNVSTPAVASGVNIDKTDPTVSIVSPLDGAVYAVGQVVIVDYSCADLLAGISSCTGPLAVGAQLPTGKKKTLKFRVTAIDQAGNKIKHTIRYQVQ